ncbi:MAG: M1 family metallopeptidase [bacterium]|nr:M1 family metallopeptidase [bacterium]
MPHQDPHSCWTFGSAQIAHVDLDLTVDFDRQVIHGMADYRFDRALDDVLRLDTRTVEIDDVSAGGRPLKWRLEGETYLGRVLSVEGARGLNALRIRFATSPSAGALQWLTPEQTAGGKLPYMFSQCQPILARSVIPCQDTPAVRFTYDVLLRVPRELAAVMAAERTEVKQEGNHTLCRFRMRHPIPSYLFALAVGNIASQRIGPFSCVYAEPEVLPEAAWEFADVQRMIEGAVELFGEYIWDRFDLLVMPPSFPYGGMENPTLTFLTPTLIAGDRSLVSIVAHELAHSWTGNLVTNATWEDFWLNEGWTVYAERRILERLYGVEFAHLQAAGGRNDLLAAFKNFSDTPQYTKLKTELAGVDPDDVFSSVPYEKGYLLLVEIERATGREAFDRFIASYIRDFAFTSITTVQFVEYLARQLPEAAKRVDLDRWIHQPGLPESAAVFSSNLIDEVRTARARWDRGERNLHDVVSGWNVQQRVLFLEEFPACLTHENCTHLERIFDIERTRNTEILQPWYCIAASSTYDRVFPAIREFLGVVGRGKYLKPIYRALHENPKTRGMARELFEKFKSRYHPVARSAVQRILEK